MNHREEAEKREERFLLLVHIFEVGETRLRVSTFVANDRDQVQLIMALPAERYFRLRPYVLEIRQAWFTLDDYLTDEARRKYEEEQLSEDIGRWIRMGIIW